MQSKYNRIKEGGWRGLKKQWVITQSERDQCFIDALRRIRENVDILKESAAELDHAKEGAEVSYHQILKDLKALKLYR